ncbi:MAG: DEAD/DEAH box helicase, partial [Clostridia bacterium]|nr:DEAD/DEAH box helicase [Clostridia bacterium]
RGQYTCKTEGGVKLGELDEEFIFETRVGDRFFLGTFAWKVLSINRDVVVVAQASPTGARLPFWHGDPKGRTMQTGFAFGQILRRLARADETDEMLEEIEKLGLDKPAAKGAFGFLKHQMECTGGLPDDKTIIIEHFTDDNGARQMMVHSVFGRPVNEPFSILVKEAATRVTGSTINCVISDDGFLLYPYDAKPLPLGLISEVVPETAREIVTAVLPTTPLYNMNFRYNTARALLMGTKSHTRQPLWIQRMRSAELLSSLVEQQKHPIIRETMRECLEDYWDLAGVEAILNGIKSGDIKVREIERSSPSPMSLPLRRKTEASMMYDYSPTPQNIHRATDKALRGVRAIRPEQQQLKRVSERARQPENAEQLHSLLMIEGDLIAGDVEVPVEWLVTLAADDRAKYIEPGLWIAAEQEQDYINALENKNFEARLKLVRRLLRYRGAMSAEQIAERYLWTDEEAQLILTRLVKQEQIVVQDGVYYHAELYERARNETIKDRRRQVTTQPAERYAALLCDRMTISAPPAEQLETALKLMSGQSHSAEAWESVLLPARVGRYTPQVLDNLLSGGSFFWQLSPDGSLKFGLTADIDWEAQVPIPEGLDENEAAVFQALLKYGASFTQRLVGLVRGSPAEPLMRLAEKELVTADSFVPVRQWLERAQIEKGTVRRRVNARVQVLTGRWEVIRSMKAPTVEQLLDCNFDRTVIVCRETVQGLSWSAALEALRIWEYTGRARRGYFVEGLSGIQFIRENDFAGTVLALQNPRGDLVWLNAADPLQPWGKCLQHQENRAFMNVAGSVVALKSGVPVAVFERQGKTLRVFEPQYLSDALSAFVRDYAGRRIFAAQTRIVVKEYPKEAEETLKSAGFSRELQDFVLYRPYQ